MLKQCLLSIKNNSYTNFESILVCCDPSRKEEILNIISNDIRFKYITAKIENLHYQRMQGIEESTGDYIACLDSDDYIDSSFYEENIHNLEKENADMAYVYCVVHDLARKHISTTPSKRDGFSVVWKKELFVQVKEYFDKLPLVNHSEDSYELSIIKHFSKKIVDIVTTGKYHYILGIPTNMCNSLNKSPYWIKKRVWSQYIESKLLDSFSIKYEKSAFSSMDVLDVLPYYKQLSEDEKQDIRSFILDPPTYTGSYELTEENIQEKMFSKYKNKIIHWIWLSNDQLPSNAQKCIKSWDILHKKGWKIKKWNLDNLPQEIINHPFVQSAIEAKKYASASDYIRLWALYNFGGIYLDSDCECLKSFDDLINNDLLLGYEEGNYIAGHFIGAKEEHPLIKKALDWYDDKLFDETWLIQGPEPIQPQMPYTLPGLLTNLFKDEKLNIYPKDYFTAKNYATKQTYITDNTYVLHHYAGSWLKTKFELSDFGFV